MATICNVRIFDGTAFRKESAVTFENSTVTALDDRRRRETWAECSSAPGLWTSTCMGRRGWTACARGQRAWREPGEYGVTSFCPLHHRDGRGHPGLSGRYPRRHGAGQGARGAGAYLEGPYLAERVKGAHNAAKLRDPELTHYKALTAGFEDEIRRVTWLLKSRGAWACAVPQGPGGGGLYRTFGRNGGGGIPGRGPGDHLPTHTCNGWNRSTTETGRPGGDPHRRRDRAEFIADLVHIDPILIRLIYRAKGVEGCYFCTDSMEAAGMPDGNYHLGNEAITVKNGMALKKEKAWRGAR